MNMLGTPKYTVKTIDKHGRKMSLVVVVLPNSFRGMGAWRNSIKWY